MRTNLILASALALTLAGTGCATKKYVAKTVAPIESRVSGTETKNTDQDKQLGDHDKKISDQGTEIESLNTDLSRTKERLTDADAKAVAAGAAAQRAGDSATNAQRSADGAQQSADRVNQRADQIERNVAAMNKFNMTTSETVLFKVNSAVLTKDAKDQLDNFSKTATGQDRFMIEVQGFTDKTGSVSTNERLSQERAEAVTRYLVNEQHIPVRSINSLGSGYAMPVADDKTRDGRKQNRRVEVRLFIPENASGKTVAAAGGGK